LLGNVFEGVNSWFFIMSGVKMSWFVEGVVKVLEKYKYLNVDKIHKKVLVFKSVFLLFTED
jgi:hypothetical protein